MSSIEIVFWGVRGSIPTPGVNFSKYGGNTSCIELILGKNILILDMGSGLKLLGESLSARNVKAFDILLTHFHYDHTCGLPFFKPAYEKDVSFSIRAANIKSRGKVSEVLNKQMSAPSFPINTDVFNANIDYIDFPINKTLTINDDVNIKTIELNHPDGATGYRVEYKGKSVCYITDHEHDLKSDNNLLENFVRASNVLIYDSTYKDSEFENFIGWGHSTWQAGSRLAEKANVDNFFIFHHNPDNDDKAMDKININASKLSPKNVVSREGMKIKI